MSPRLAASVALRIASGTSRALPWPKPTRPFSSPTTTERGKAEAAAALHHLGHTIDVDELVGEFAVALVAVLVRVAWFTCHIAQFHFVRAAPVHHVIRNSSPPSRAASASALTRP